MAVLNSSTFYLHFWLKWLHSVCSDYIITAQIESQEEAKSSSVFFLQSAAKKLERGKKRGKKNDLKTEKTETGKPNFTNSQTDIGYMGEVGTGGGRLLCIPDKVATSVVKTSMNCMLL